MSKQGYHHGNLRQALVASALELIEEKGPTGFTLSEAAKRAGVTPAAVYRHFEGREDLIAECARQGYLIFGDGVDLPMLAGMVLIVGSGLLTLARERQRGVSLPPPVSASGAQAAAAIAAETRGEPPKDA